MRTSTRQASSSMPQNANESFNASSHGPSISPVNAYNLPPASQPYGGSRHDVPALQPMPTRMIPSPTPSVHRRGPSPERDENLRRYPSRPY